MGQSRKKKNVGQKIDLSSLEQSEVSSTFEVKDYDYDDLQTGKSETEVKFETDLQYLLDTANEEASGETKTELKSPNIHVARKSPKKGKKVKSRAAVKKTDITGDIDDIVFSSDDDEEEGEETKNVADDITDPETHKESEESTEVTKSPKPKKKRNKKKRQAEKKTEEINADKSTQPENPEKEESANAYVSVNAEVSQSNQFENEKVEQEPEAEAKEVVTEEIKKGDNKRERSLQEEETQETKMETDDVSLGETEISLPKGTPEIAEKSQQVIEEPIPEETQVNEICEETQEVKEETGDSSPEETQEAKDGKPSKSKKNRRKKKNKKAKAAEAKTNEEDAEDGGETSPEQNKDTPKETSASSKKETTPKPKQEEPLKKPESPFGKPRSLAAATSLSQLPEIQPIITIIGLSHQQILRMKPTDVKIKTLHSVNNLSKTCKNVLLFAQKETDGFFQDSRKRAVFVELCVSVALNESSGFNAMATKHSHMVDWLEKYDELMLQHTGTKLTLSKKEAHTNNFDYTVFSYIGHIILWAQHLQESSGIETILDKYDLGLTRKNVMASLGGYHLWDRIRRDPKSINTKRWKHIQKFRQNFAFEQNQFVLILRYMRLGIDLPAQN